MTVLGGPPPFAFLADPRQTPLRRQQARRRPRGKIFDKSRHFFGVVVVRVDPRRDATSTGLSCPAMQV